MMKPMGDEQLFAIDEQVDQGYGDFNLEACGVNIGDTIIYTPTGQELTVLEDNRLEHDGVSLYQLRDSFLGVKKK